MRLTASASALCALVLLGACDKQETPTAPEAPAATPTEQAGDAPDPAAAPEPAQDTPEELTWSQMNDPQKKKFMGTVFLPAMKKEFQAHDGEEFAEFNCKTCHGENADEVGWHLPNDLVPLPKENTWQAALDMDEEATKFMGEVVVPKAAEMFSMKPKEEFGCFDCHPSE